MYSAWIDDSNVIHVCPDDTITYSINDGAVRRNRDPSSPKQSDLSIKAFGEINLTTVFDAISVLSQVIQEVQKRSDVSTDRMQCVITMLVKISGHMRKVIQYGQCNSALWKRMPGAIPQTSEEKSFNASVMINIKSITLLIIEAEILARNCGGDDDIFLYKEYTDLHSFLSTD